MADKKQALVVYGGWEGHQPNEVGHYLGSLLAEEGIEVSYSDTLDVFKDQERLSRTDLIVPVWTMGKISNEQLNPFLEAVREGGTGVAGCHGGMGDSFRDAVEYQYMVGGQWVSHPGGDGITYQVDIIDPADPLTPDMETFTVVSEQYYMHVDPAIRVLATTNFGATVMPVAWTKTYGKGKVYYNSLGHQENIVRMPETTKMMKLGMLWAIR